MNRNEVFNFIVENSRKRFATEKLFRKTFGELYDEFVQSTFCDDLVDTKFTQRLWHFLQNDCEGNLGRCPVCDKRCAFVNFVIGYKHHCSDRCTQLDKSVRDKIKCTNYERYGDENYNNRDGAMKTNLERYGGTGSLNSPVIRDRIYATNLEKYGNVNVFGSEYGKNKIKETNYKKYGSHYYTQTDEYKQKMVEHNMEEYGIPYYFQTDEYKQKVVEHNMEEYGVPYYLQSEDCKKKIKRTNLDKYGVEHYTQSDDFKKKCREYWKQLNISDKEYVIDVVDGLYVCKCTDCDCNLCDEKIFKISPQNYTSRGYYCVELCTIKNPIYNRSCEQNKIIEFIKSIYSGEIIENDRKLLCGKELDIYLPEKNIAFEFNGVYWHSEVYKDKKYHKNKTELCLKHGVQLIHIWEDDWILKQDVIKDIICSKLGLNEHIYARKCEIREISSNESRDFLNKYHLQGNVNASVRIGLFYNNKLVEVATFGKLRKIMNSKGNSCEYELYRLCAMKGLSVVGGFSKLLKYFIDNYKPTKIITYASRDISNGNVYEMVGFEKEKVTTPGYTWIKNGKREYRYKFRKQIIQDDSNSDLTEVEIMHNRGSYRCYDSGNIKYVYKMSHKNSQ